MKNLTNKQISDVLGRKVSQEVADGFRKLATQPQEIISLLRKSEPASVHSKMKALGYSERQINAILELRLSLFVELMNEFDAKFNSVLLPAPSEIEKIKATPSYLVKGEVLSVTHEPEQWPKPCPEWECTPR